MVETRAGAQTGERGFFYLYANVSVYFVRAEYIYI